jgi:hypothetical protein
VGCTWDTEVSAGVVTEMRADPTECETREWTVEQLHEIISEWLKNVERFASPEFGEHTLAVRFDDDGVPVTMDFDLANADDDEHSMRVTFTALP